MFVTKVDNITAKFNGNFLAALPCFKNGDEMKERAFITSGKRGEINKVFLISDGFYDCYDTEEDCTPYLTECIGTQTNEGIYVFDEVTDDSKKDIFCINWGDKVYHIPLKHPMRTRIERDTENGVENILFDVLGRAFVAVHGEEESRCYPLNEPLGSFVSA